MRAARLYTRWCALLYAQLPFGTNTKLLPSICQAQQGTAPPPPTHPRGILEAARDKEQYYPAY
jgi:hypothetical protein